MNNLEIITDVVVRYLAHDQYGSAEKAAKVLSRRLGSVQLGEAIELIKLHSTIYEATINKITQALSHTPGLTEELFNSIKNEISNELSCKDIEASSYINWCYFWYVLK
jgi:hypothetical protein